MAESRYELTAAQTAFLEHVRQPAPADARTRSLPKRARFPGPLPSVADQSVRGTCVANAVAALVACYEGCRRRVSVQYLDEVTRLVEQSWVTRNLKRLSSGETVERDFDAAFPEAVSQAALLIRANGAGTEAATAFVRALGAKMRARVEADEGCRLKWCFEALEEYGVCREDLWPYSPVALNVGAAGGDAVGSFPPGTHEDARRHRIVNGLYVLRAPNNVDEIKGILAGAQGRRPMPVCAGFELFEGCTDGGFALPDVTRSENGAWVSQRPLGIHEVLLVSFTDDEKSPGGGFFTFQNSWGRAWGEKGFGRVSYAYVACFCREAGTILQEPDDYGPGMASQMLDPTFIARRRRATILCAVGICLTAAVVSVGFTVWALRSARTQVPRSAFASAPRPASRPAPAAEVDSSSGDDEIVIERIVNYRYAVRGTCDSSAEATGISYLLDGAHRDFSFENMRLVGDGHGFEGEMTVEGPRGRAPNAVKILDDYLQRKNRDLTVRKWDVRRLR